MPGLELEPLWLVWRGEEALGGHPLRSSSGRKRPNSLRA